MLPWGRRVRPSGRPRNSTRSAEMAAEEVRLLAAEKTELEPKLRELQPRPWPRPSPGPSLG
jgi:hypothetical protein